MPKILTQPSDGFKRQVLANIRYLCDLRGIDDKELAIALQKCR